MTEETIYELIRIALQSLGFFLIILIIPLIVWLVIYIIGICNLYKKAGRKEWEAIIPIYNKWVLVEIAELDWWWFLILIATNITTLIIPIPKLGTLALLATLIGKFACFYNISKKLNKDTSFAILTTLFSGIMIPIIGISKSYQFNKEIQVSKLGPFSNIKENTNTQKKFCSSCGNTIKNNDKYCPNCGTKIK